MTTRWSVLFCGLLLFSAARADDWPTWRGPTRDGVWRETGLIEKFADAEVPIVWRVPVGSGYTGPTVSSGRVYLMDRVHEPVQQERVLCFDQKTGKTLWEHKYECQYRVGYPAGPRASVVCDDGKAYSLGTMGHFCAFDAAGGKLLWNHDLDAEYKINMPVWGITAAPLIVGDLLIVQVGGDGACIVAFDKQSGKERWRALNDRASYAAPVLVEQGGKPVVVCLTGDNVVGLDPKSGSVYWSEPFPPAKMPIAISTPIVDKNRLFITSFYDGSLMMKLDDKSPQAEKLWRRKGFDEKHTDALHSIISTPIFLGDYVYGVDSYGELRCLHLLTGDRVWESDKAVPHERWATIHFVQHGDDTWMFNEKGELIIGRLSPKGFEEIDRAKLIEPTKDQLPSRRGGVAWSHPAFANKCIFARSDEKLVCASLADAPKNEPSKGE